MNKEYLEVKHFIATLNWFFSEHKIYIIWQYSSLQGLYNVLYLYGFQEQEAVAAAKMDASQIDLENCSDELQAAHELAAAATAAVAKSRKVFIYMPFIQLCFSFRLTYFSENLDF